MRICHNKGSDIGMDIIIVLNGSRKHTMNAHFWPRRMRHTKNTDDIVNLKTIQLLIQIQVIIAVMV